MHVGINRRKIGVMLRAPSAAPLDDKILFDRISHSAGRRVGRHHAPRTELARERLSVLRRMWALLLVGSGAGFAGAAFVLTSLHHWFVNPERNASLLLVPLGLTSI